jgi:hypothetical protein
MKVWLGRTSRVRILEAVAAARYASASICAPRVTVCESRFCRASVDRTDRLAPRSEDTHNIGRRTFRCT